jgi:predicted HAD superfamily Cof-like phosphohydrolase
MSPEQKMVRDFHKKFGAPIAYSPQMISPKDRLRRCRLIQSEAAEFTECADKGDLVGMIDALADLLVVVYGAAIEMGVDLEPFFREVHRSNMTKSQEKDAGGKIMKGPDYSPPDLESILKRQQECGDWSCSPCETDA